MEGTDEKPVAESSLEDRVAALYNKEEVTEGEIVEDAPVEASEDTSEEVSEEVSDESPTGEIPEFLDVEYDGRTYQVPPELKDALMRQADYTQKTQALSNQRQGLDLQTQEFEQMLAARAFMESTAQEQQQLAQFQMLEEQFNQLDWSAMSTDEMVRTKHQVDELAKEKQKVFEALNAKQGQFAQQQAQAKAQFLAQGEEYLSKSFGSWTSEMKQDTAKYMLERGYPQEYVRSVADPRFVEAFHKAMKYDSLKQGQAKAVKVAKDGPVIKPKSSTRPMPDDVKAKLNLRNKLKGAKDSQAKSEIILGRLAEMYGDKR